MMLAFNRSKCKQRPTSAQKNHLVDQRKVVFKSRENGCASKIISSATTYQLKPAPTDAAMSSVLPKPLATLAPTLMFSPTIALPPKAMACCPA